MRFNIFESTVGACVAVEDALTEREALIQYLLRHEELDDIMLWKSTDRSSSWKLAKYDQEDEYLYAKVAPHEDNLWEFFNQLPEGYDMQIFDTEGKLLTVSYGSISDSMDEYKIQSVKRSATDNTVFIVKVEKRRDE